MKKIITAVCITLGMCLLLGAKDGQCATKKTDKVIYVTKGKTVTLNKKFDWTCKEKKYIQIKKKYKVKALKKGAQYVVGTKGKKIKKYKIVVECPKFNKKMLKIEDGSTAKLKLNGTKRKVSWSSSDEETVTVDKNGVISAESIGKAYIFAEIGEESYKIQISVTYRKIYDENSTEDGSVYYVMDTQNDCLDLRLGKYLVVTDLLPNYSAVPVYKDGVQVPASDIKVGDRVSVQIALEAMSFPGQIERCDRIDILP